MQDVLVGLLAIAVGALFAARGYVAMRLIIPWWGAVLVVLTAFGGSSAIVFGLMMLFDTVSTSDLKRASFTERLDEGWFWWVLYVAIAIVGIVIQSRLVASLRTSARAQWQSAPAAQPAR